MNFNAGCGTFCSFNLQPKSCSLLWKVLPLSWERPFSYAHNHKLAKKVVHGLCSLDKILWSRFTDAIKTAAMDHNLWTYTINNIESIKNSVLEQGSERGLQREKSLTQVYIYNDKGQLHHFQRFSCCYSIKNTICKEIKLEKICVNHYQINIGDRWISVQLLVRSVQTFDVNKTHHCKTYATAIKLQRS